MEFDERIVCGAAVGRENGTTVLVLHPDLSEQERNELATELLDDQEIEQWVVQRC